MARWLLLGFSRWQGAGGRWGALTGYGGGAELRFPLLLVRDVLPPLLDDGHEVGGGLLERRLQRGDDALAVLLRLPAAGVRLARRPLLEVLHLRVEVRDRLLDDRRHLVDLLRRVVEQRAPLRHCTQAAAALLSAGWRRGLGALVAGRWGEGGRTLGQPLELVRRRLDLLPYRARVLHELRAGARRRRRRCGAATSAG